MWNNRFWRKIERLDAVIEEQRVERERTERLGRLCPHAKRRCKARPIGACSKARALGLNDEGRPLPKSERPVCGARTRNGGICEARAVPGKRRCRLHGGLSMGAKTIEGRARQSETYQRWRSRF